MGRFFLATMKYPYFCYQELTPRLVLRDEKRAWAGPKAAVPLGAQPWSFLEETD